MKRLNGVDFPKFCVENFQINQLEYVEDDMRPPRGSEYSLDEYLDQIRAAVGEAKLGDASGKIVCVALRNDFTKPKELERQADVEHIRQWIYRAGRLEVPMARIYIGRHPFEGETPKHVLECIEQILRDAEKANVRLAIENRGGRREKPEDIAGVVENFNSQYLGVCLDLGCIYTGGLEHYLEVLAPHTIHVHAKSYPDEGEMPFPRVDYPRCVAALKDVGYDGYWVVEYEDITTNLDAQVQGVHQTLNLLHRQEW